VPGGGHLFYRLTGAGQRLLGLPRVASAHCRGRGRRRRGSIVSCRRSAPSGGKSCC